MTAVSAPDLPNDEQAWSKLLAASQAPRHSHADLSDAPGMPLVQSPVLITVDGAPPDETIVGNDVAAVVSATADGGSGRVVTGIVPNMGERKPSFIDSFNRQLRSSFRAVSDSPGAIQRYRQTRYSNRRVRKRVIFKHGDCNVVQGNVAKRRRRYMQDIFTTLVDAQWRWTLMVFAMSFILTWTVFAMVWWTIAYGHGDFEYMDQLRRNALDADHQEFLPCVTEIKGFPTCFLFSVETQHTIGYGNRYITDECPEAIFTMCLQCIVGVFIQAFMVGIVFAKLARPIKRAQTLLFSRNAVICHRDGIPCLMFRVGDMRKSHIIEAHVRAQIIRKKVTQEGEVLPFFQQELSIGADGGQDRLMFIWPTTMLHKIDRHSPLYALSAQDMLRERFEIVVMLEGVVESTGMTTQARSSYLPTEILWGHRFEHVVTFRKDSGEYEVDYTLFNNTYEVDTPLCSSKQLDEVRAELHSPNGLERLCSAGLLPRVSSAVSIDLPSDESAESIGRLQMHPIPSQSAMLPPVHHQMHNHHMTMQHLPHPNHQQHYQQPHHHHNHHNHHQQHQQQQPHNQLAQLPGSLQTLDQPIMMNPAQPYDRPKGSNQRLSIRQDQQSIDSMC